MLKIKRGFHPGCKVIDPNSDAPTYDIGPPISPIIIDLNGFFKRSFMLLKHMQGNATQMLINQMGNMLLE